jgi:hypothetical protein
MSDYIKPVEIYNNDIQTDVITLYMNSKNMKYFLITKFSVIINQFSIFNEIKSNFSDYQIIMM